MSIKCDLPSQCKKCGKRHHISLCDAISPTPPPPPPPPTPVDPNVAQNSGQMSPMHVPNYQFQPNPYSNQYFPRTTNPYVAQNLHVQTNTLQPNFSYHTPLNPGVPSFPAPLQSPSNVHVQQTSPGTGYRPTVNNCTSSSSDKSTLLGSGCTRVSNVSNESLSTIARLLFDDCSQRTYMRQSLKEKLQLPIVRYEKTEVKSFGGRKEKFEQLEVVLLRVKLLNGKNLDIEALVVPIVCAPIPNQYPKAAKLNYPHLKNLFLADFVDESDMEVDVLVGVDIYWSIVTGNVVRDSDPRSPVALETHIGWVLSGVSMYPKENTHSMVTVTLSTVADDRFNDTMKQFWEIQESPDPVVNVMEQFKKDVEFNGSKYVVELPFKQDDEILPDNYRLSLRRLNTLCKRFEKDPKTRWYHRESTSWRFWDAR